MVLKGEIMTESLSELIDEFQDQNKLWNTSGSNGVKNLCRLTAALGYVDNMHFGQFEHGCYGDLILFLEDNPGCIEAIETWIKEQGGDEWKENIESHLIEKDEEE